MSIGSEDMAEEIMPYLGLDQNYLVSLSCGGALDAPSACSGVRRRRFTVPNSPHLPIISSSPLRNHLGDDKPPFSTIKPCCCPIAFLSHYSIIAFRDLEIVVPMA